MKPQVYLLIAMALAFQGAVYIVAWLQKDPLPTREKLKAGAMLVGIGLSYAAYAFDNQVPAMVHVQNILDSILAAGALASCVDVMIWAARRRKK